MTELSRTQILDSQVAGELRKWASLWADLLHVDMTLSRLLEMPATAADVFVRRALWEGAVIAYGRMAMSDRKRKVDFNGLLDASPHQDARRLHDRVMDWRHGHVAHRRESEFEQSVVTAQYDAADELVAIALSVVPSTGPLDENLIEQLAKHVSQLRSTLWERYMSGRAEVLAREASAATAPAIVSTAKSLNESDTARFSINLTLWHHDNDTGLGTSTTVTSS